MRRFDCPASQKLSSKVLGELGLRIAKHPHRVLLLLPCITAVLALGFIRTKVVTDGIKLWVPQSSKAMVNGREVGSIYETNDNFAMLIIEPQNKTAGALSPEVFSELFHVHDLITKNVSDDHGRKYANLCLRTEASTSKCYASGYLQFWSANSTLFLESKAAADVGSLLDKVNGAAFPNGESVKHLQLCGRPTYRRQGGSRGDEAASLLSNCEVTKVKYALAKHLTIQDIKSWLHSLDKVLLGVNQSARHIQVHAWHSLSLDDAVEDSVAGDAWLMATSLALMVVTSVLMLVKFKKKKLNSPKGTDADSNDDRWLCSRYTVDWKRSRILLGFLSIFNVMLAMVSGYGIAIGVFGIEFSTLCAVLPFILVGIGIDDAFVLVCGVEKAARMDREDLASAIHTVEVTKNGQNSTVVNRIVEQRIKRAMESMGPTVSATSITNCIAFLLGSFTSIPALRSFCLYAGICIICDFIMQVTFFVAAMVIIERKQVLFSIVAENTDGTESNHDAVSVFDVLGWLIGRSAVWFCGMEERGSATNPPQNCRWFWRTAVLVMSIVFAVISIFQISLLKQGLPLKDLTMAGTSLCRFFELEDSTFGQQVGPETYLYVVNPLANNAACSTIGKRAGNASVGNSETILDDSFSSPAYQARVITMHYFVLSRSKYIQEAEENWLADLLRFASQGNNATVPGEMQGETFDKVLGAFIPKDEFSNLLESFLASPRYSHYADDLHYGAKCSHGDTGGTAKNSIVLSGRFGYLHTPSGDNYGLRKQALTDIRELEQEIQSKIWGPAGGSRSHIFFYSRDYLFWEQDAVLLRECLLSLGLAVLGVLLISFITTGGAAFPITAIVVAIAVVDLYLFGFLSLLGLRFNAVTVVNLVMAVGLSIDYSLHIAHNALDKSDGLSNGVHRSLREVGPAVFAGGASTFMAVIPLAGSRCFIFQMFFKLMLGTVLFGQFVSLILLPTLLACIMPSSPPVPNSQAPPISKA